MLSYTRLPNTLIPHASNKMRILSYKVSLLVTALRNLMPLVCFALQFRSILYSELRDAGCMQALGSRKLMLPIKYPPQLVTFHHLSLSQLWDYLLDFASSFRVRRADARLPRGETGSRGLLLPETRMPPRLLEDHLPLSYSSRET